MQMIDIKLNDILLSSIEQTRRLAMRLHRLMHSGHCSEKQAMRLVNQIRQEREYTKFVLAEIKRKMVK